MRATERSEALGESYKEAAHMNDYMKALHQRFFREPELPGLQRELERTQQALREKLARQDRGCLLRLADLEIELREEVSLASFIAGFRLGMGIAGEVEPYSFEDDEEERARRRIEKTENQSTDT